MSIDWGEWYGSKETKKKKGKTHWWDGWFEPEKKVNLSKLQDYLLGQILSFSMGIYKGAGITIPSLQGIAWELKLTYDEDKDKSDAEVLKAIRRLKWKGLVDVKDDVAIASAKAIRQYNEALRELYGKR